MATEEHFNVMNFPPSPQFLPTLSSVPPPPHSPSSSNSMVVYQGSGQSSMDNPLQNRQQSVSMAAPTNIEESDMATEEYLIYWNTPSPSSNSMVAYYQGSSQSSMDNPLQNRQQSVSMAAPTNIEESDMATEEYLIYWNTPSPSSNSMVAYYQGSSQSSMDNPLQNRQQSVSMAAPTNIEESDMATEEYLIYWNTPSPSSNSMVAYYQGSSQSSMDNPLQNRQQRPANCGDQSDMAAEEHFDVTSLLNLPQWSPPPSPCSSANSTLVYQQWSGQSSIDFVDRPLYISGDVALTRQKLLQFWMVDDEWGPRGGVMSMNNKENLPQSLECLGISLVHLYVEDEFDTLLYWPGESSREHLRGYLLSVLKKLLQGGEFGWVYACSDLERKDYGQGMFGTERITMVMWQIGPREWVAKIFYQRHSLESPYYVNERGRYCYSDEVGWRTTQVVFEDARLNFPDLIPDFLYTARKDPGEHVMDYIFRTTPVTDGRRFDYWLIGKAPFLWTANPDEDLDNGEVKPLRIEGEGTEEAEIAESQLDPGPSRKRQRKEKTPAKERGNKKTTRVKNVIPLDKILQVKELRLKGAAELLKVSRSAPKRACREHGINRWPPRDKHEGIVQSLPDETPAVVDQEGIPQLTSDTLPSDQALTTTIDTNSVVEETAPQQFLPTVRQENPDEDSGNAEVQPVGMGGVGPREGEMQSNEKAPGRERSKYKTTGVRIELALEEIIRYKEMPLKDATRELKVSKSTLKRICRSYKIPRWPPCEEHKLESAIVVDREGIPQLNSDMLLPPNQISAPGDTNSMTVKAKYKGFRIKFQLSWPWRKVELEQEVKKRLQLDAATYYITYKDEDDEMTLIGCDEDLEGFISSISPLGTHSIELFLEPK